MPTEEEIAQETARERADWARMEAAVRRFADAVACSPRAWKVGDGCGGAVLYLLYRELMDRGVNFAAYGMDMFRPRPVVELLASRDGWDCAYCGCPLGYGHPSVVTPEVEHVVPRSRGGSDDTTNLVLSCGPCNQAKGTMTGDEYRTASR